jgi:hypothetical protein
MPVISVMHIRMSFWQGKQEAEQKRAHTNRPVERGRGEKERGRERSSV